MGAPLRCLSSQATQIILEFRNPQGKEENWIGAEERINHVVVHIAKVAIAEVGSGLLLCVATVETVAYSVFFLSSILMYYWTDEPFHFSADLLSSSGFTVIWNIGNLLVFNIFCINAVTDESIARFTIDEWPRGRVLKTVLTIIAVSLALFSSCVTRRSWNSIVFLNVFNRLTYKFTRDEDVLYIADWLRRIQREVLAIPQDINPILRRVVEQGRETNSIIDRGSDLFKKYIIDDGQIAPASREAVVDMFPVESIFFALSRIVFVLVFKEKTIALDFLKTETKAIIEELRRGEYQNSEATLEPYMNSLERFDEGANNREIHFLFNKIKEAAIRESQGSIFIQRCYKKACDDYRRVHPAQENVG
jgi:hypothetical protein